MTELHATGLAKLIGGEAHNSGGDVWLVTLERADGRFAVFGDEGGEVYSSRKQWLRAMEVDTTPDIVEFW